MEQTAWYMQSLQLIILAMAFIIGQFLHIIKKNKLDSHQLFKDWYQDHSFSFWIQIIVGLSVLESLMAQLSMPTNVFGWFAFFYTGIAAGIAGSSIGMTADEEVKKRKNGGK